MKDLSLLNELELKIRELVLLCNEKGKKILKLNKPYRSRENFLKLKKK